jgi:hypothetical protein
MSATLTREVRVRIISGMQIVSSGIGEIDASSKKAKKVLRAVKNIRKALETITKEGLNDLFKKDELEHLGRVCLAIEAKFSEQTSTERR